MAVSVRGRVHKLRVRPGPDGKEDFKRQVRALLGYDDSMEFDVIFECKTPHSGEQDHGLAGCWQSACLQVYACTCVLIIHERQLMCFGRLVYVLLRAYKCTGVLSAGCSLPGKMMR
jgi:hypothetical protein